MSTIISFLTRLLFVGAAAGFGLSALAHLLSFLSFSFPTNEAFYVLEFGVFAFVIPMLIIQFTDPEVRELRQNRPFFDITGSHERKVMAAMTRYAPDWARKLYYVIIAYGIIITFLGWGFLTSRTDPPSLYMPRVFGVFGMIFYYHFALVFFSKAREQALNEETIHPDMATRYQPWSPDDQPKWPR